MYRVLLTEDLYLLLVMSVLNIHIPLQLKEQKEERTSYLQRLLKASNLSFDLIWLRVQCHRYCLHNFLALDI